MVRFPIIEDLCTSGIIGSYHSSEAIFNARVDLTILTLLKMQTVSSTLFTRHCSIDTVTASVDITTGVMTIRMYGYVEIIGPCNVCQLYS